MHRGLRAAALFKSWSTGDDDSGEESKTRKSESIEIAPTSGSEIGRGSCFFGSRKAVPKHHSLFQRIEPEQYGQTVHHRTLVSTAWNAGSSPQPTRATICPHAKMRTRAGNTATRHTRNAFFLDNTSCLARSGKLCHALLQPSTSTRAAADSPRSDAVSRLPTVPTAIIATRPLVECFIFMSEAAPFPKPGRSEHSAQTLRSHTTPLRSAVVPLGSIRETPEIGQQSISSA